MKPLSKKSDIVKIMSFGDYDFELNLNVTEDQALKYELDFDKIKSIIDMKSLLANQEIKENITVSCKNQLMNMLLFFNKTNKKKIFIEYLTLNSLYFGEEFTYLKDKIMIEFDDCYIQLKEINLLPPNQFTLKINFENKGQICFYIKISTENKIVSAQCEKFIKPKEENKIDIKAEIKLEYRNGEIDMNETKIFEIKKEETKKINPKNEEAKRDDFKKEDSKHEALKKEEHKKDEPKKEEHIKEEHKKEEHKKEEYKKEEPKNEEPKNEESKKEEPKKEEPKNEENLKEEIIKKEKDNNENKPKQGKNEKINRLKLPNVERPFDKRLVKVKDEFPEGKEEDDEIGLLNYNLINKYKQSPLILTQKTTNLNNSSLSINSDKLYQKSNEDISHLKYDFDSCDYIILDLNMFIENKKISLNDIYDYLCQNILKNYLSTSIILVFPSKDNLKIGNYAILLDLISIADIMLYDRQDAAKLCNLMGYKVEDKNFEVRFMFLNEMKRAKYKPHKTALFLYDFNKFTVIVQETDSNLIVVHNEYNFNVCFKMENYNTIRSNFIMLKSAFLGSVLSRVIQRDEYDFAFFCGNQTFKKLLDAFFIKVDTSQDPGYFILNNNHEDLNKNTKNSKKNRSLKSNSEKKFLLDSINVRNSKLKPYDPFNDKSLKSFFSNKSIKKTLKLQGIKVKTKEKESQIKGVSIDFIKQEQSKYSNMLEQNQILQKNLMNFLSSPNKNKEKVNSSLTKISKLFQNQSSETINNSRKMPSLEKIDNIPFEKIANAPDYLQYQKKKINLKPIKQSNNKPQIIENNETISKTSNLANPQMVNLMINLQNHPIDKSRDDSPNKDNLITQTGFNPELIQHFMATIKKNGFDLTVNKSIPIKVNTAYNQKWSKRNILHDRNKSNKSLKDIKGSFEENKLAIQQINTSMENKSRSRSNKKKSKDKNKVEKKVFEPKGIFFDVDNSKIEEQLQYEEEYQKKLKHRKLKQEEDMKAKIDKDKFKNQEEDSNKKQKEDFTNMKNNKIIQIEDKLTKVVESIEIK